MAQADLALPPALDGSTAAALKSALLSVRGKPVLVEGAAVERVGAAGLQILLAAVQVWREDGLEFTLSNPSTPLIDGFQLSGLTSSDLSTAHGV
jgi:anti-anti-sigma regulatory factor